MNDKRQQLRRTFEDTKKAQVELRKLILKKKRGTDVLDLDEKDRWMDLLANSFLSVGIDQKVYINKPTVRIFMGNLHTFALKFMDYENQRIKVRYNNHVYNVDLQDLWDKLYDCCMEIFPYALADALHMSKETEEREKWDPFSFSSDNKLED